MNLGRVAVCVAAVALAGCVSTVQVVPLPDQGKSVQDPALARIYVIRPTYAGGAHSMQVVDGDRKVGSTGPYGYLCWERPPGPVTLEATAANVDHLELSVAAGSVTYVEQVMLKWPGWFTVGNRLQVVNQQKGAEILARCDPPEVESP